MDIALAFPSKYIKAADLQGKEPSLTITNVTLEELQDEQGGTKTKGVVTFAETKRQWVLNRTNAMCLKAMWGSETSKWHGRKVTLCVGDWNGEPCIRVKGSPDLKEPVNFELRLPRKKPRRMTMTVTLAKTANGNGIDATPAPAHDPQTGELLGDA